MKKILNIKIFILLNLFQNFTATAQWVQTNGPTGGFITALVVSGTNVFAGTDKGGVFLSTDNGSSWTEKNNGLTNSSVSSLATVGSNIFAQKHNAAGLQFGRADCKRTSKSFRAINNFSPRKPSKRNVFATFDRKS